MNDISVYLNTEEFEKLFLFSLILNKSKSRYIADYCISKMKNSQASNNLLIISQHVYTQTFFKNKKFVNKDIYFVDYENLNSDTFSYLSKMKDSIIYYVTNRYLKVDTSMIDHSNIVYIETRRSNNKNCADFLLDIALLNMVENYGFNKIEILSNDRGFQGMISIINSIYQQKCVQKTRMDIIDVEHLPLHKIIDDTKQWIANKPTLDLPCVRADLEKAIREQLYGKELDYDIVKSAIHEISREGILCFYGETIHYQGVRYHGA